VIKIKTEKVDREKLSDIVYGYTADTGRFGEESLLLKETVAQLKAEIERFRKSPLMVCEVRELYGQQAVIRIPNGNQFFVEVASDCERLKSGDSVLVEQRNLTVVRKARSSKRHNVEKFVIVDKPDVSWADIGGMQEQINEIREVVELPLTRPELFKRVGIQPPKGVLLHGPPGTGKTLLAKAVASSTNSTFIEIIGSELVQKFIGEGAKMVKEVFQLAREKEPSIVFVDELDAIAARRIELGTSGEREVQRTFMQLLAEIDGFRNLGKVKVVGCTNRKDILDPAVLRPGRFDRQIEVPLPNKDSRREIFGIHSKDMNAKEVNIPLLCASSEGFSGADIKAVCTEAGYFAIRSNREKVTHEDFVNAIEKIRRREQPESNEYRQMFG